MVFEGVEEGEGVFVLLILLSLVYDVLDEECWLVVIQHCVWHVEFKKVA